MPDAEFPLAPGCFGAPLAFRSSAPECETCSFAAVCGPRSKARTEALRVKFGIVAPDKKKISDQGFSVPVKTQAVLDQIAKLGVDVALAIKSGVNPLKRKNAPVFMAFACHLLLRDDPEFTRKKLEELMVEKFKWTRGTAVAHALQAVQALVALGAADEIEGRITRRKSND